MTDQPRTICWSKTMFTCNFLLEGHLTSLPFLRSRMRPTFMTDSEHQVAHTQSESATFYCRLERNVHFLIDLLVDFLLYFLLYFLIYFLVNL